MDPTRVVAVDIGGTKIATGIVTFDGDSFPEVSSVEKIPTDPLRGGTSVLHDVIRSIKAAIERAEGPVAGVGISTGGVVNPKTGDITYANEMMPGWSGTKLGSEVASATGLSCRVLNDVHAHALGEARWGGGSGSASGCRGTVSCIMFPFPFHIQSKLRGWYMLHRLLTKRSVTLDLPVITCDTTLGL